MFAWLYQRSAAWSALLLVVSTAGLTEAATPRMVLRESQARVVKLFGAGGLSGLEAYQSGLLVSAEGHIVTVNSSVLDEGEVTVVTIDGGRRSGLVVGADPIADLAVLRVDAAESLPFFDLTSPTVDASPDVTLAGEPVWALANLFGIATGDEPVSVMQGFVASVAPLRARRGVARSFDRGESLVLDMVTSNPGAAGGAVVNRQGRLLGVLGRELRSEATGAWVSHATPAPEVARVVRNILDGGSTLAASEARRVPVDLLASWGFALTPDIAARTPPYVDYVLPDSPADQAGLRADDLVVMWNGRVSATCREVQRLADATTQSASVVVTVQRGESLFDLTVVPADASSRSRIPLTPTRNP